MPVTSVDRTLRDCGRPGTAAKRPTTERAPRRVPRGALRDGARGADEGAGLHPARLCLVSPALAILLAPRHLRALHARFGGLDGVDEDDPRAVARALFARVLPGALVLALEDIERLATAIGREGILEAARGRVDDLAAWARASPIDLAVRVVLGAARPDDGGARARAIARRARVRVERYFSPRASYEIVLPGALERPDALLDAAREVHGDTLIDAWTVTHDGVVHGAFLHEAPAERVVRARDGVLAGHTFRPLATDRARFDGGRGRIGFLLARPAQLPAWTAAVGRAGYGDPARIATRPAFTLRAPHERGPAWFDPAALPPPVRHVTIVGCELDDGERFSVRGRAALADLHARLGVGGGYLVRVTLRFEMRGGERTDATIELPSKLTVADPRFEDDVRAALDAMQLTSPGALADDLGSLAPFEHAAWRWGEMMSARDFEAAVAHGLLTRAGAARRASDAAHRPYGSSLILHDLPGEVTRYALGEDLGVHAYDVPLESTVRWTLDAPRFAASLAARLHLAGAQLKRPLPAGLLALGALDARDSRACVVVLMRLVRDAEAAAVREALRLACHPAHPVVLLGKGRTLGKGIAEVEVDLARLFAQDDLGDVMASIAEALGIEDEIDPWRFGTGAKPLVLMAARGQAWLGKVRLLVTANQLAMLLALARTPCEWVSVADLGARISPHAAHADVVVRRARVGWEERVAASFADAGVPMLEGIAARIVEVDRGRGMYRLGVGVVVRGA